MQINHSQALNASSLKSWVLLKKDGDIVTAHCICMAGLGSVCSHVAAVLFFLELCTIKKRETTCTSTPCSWLAPRSQANIAIGEIRKCNFRSPATKNKAASTPKAADSNLNKKPSLDSYKVPSSDIISFLENVSKTDSRSAILSVVRPFCVDRATPDLPADLNKSKLPPVLTDLLDLSAATMDYEQLALHCEGLFKSLSVSKEQASVLEKVTRLQASNPLWKKHRAGCITASKIGQVCATSITDPSLSLLKSICFPQECEFYSKDTERGKIMEKGALQAFERVMQQSHQQAEIKQAGLHILTDLPFIRASPDAIVTCQCHGTALVEIKTTKVVGEDICGLANGILGTKHKYYAQVQCQMLVTKIPTCYFVAVTVPTDVEKLAPTALQNIVSRLKPQIVEINENKPFQERMLKKAVAFFKKVVLPELVCRFFSTHLLDSSKNPHLPQKICICQGPPQVPMINCMAKTCTVVTFHRNCVKAKAGVKRWTCDACNAVKGKRKPLAVRNVSMTYINFISMD